MLTLFFATGTALANAETDTRTVESYLELEKSARQVKLYCGIELKGGIWVDLSTEPLSCRSAQLAERPAITLRKGAILLTNRDLELVERSDKCKMGGEGCFAHIGVQVIEGSAYVGLLLKLVADRPFYEGYPTIDNFDIGVQVGPAQGDFVQLDSAELIDEWIGQALENFVAQILVTNSLKAAYIAPAASGSKLEDTAADMILCPPCALSDGYIFTSPPAEVLAALLQKNQIQTTVLYGGLAFGGRFGFKLDPLETAGLEKIKLDSSQEFAPLVRLDSAWATLAQDTGIEVQMQGAELLRTNTVGNTGTGVNVDIQNYSPTLAKVLPSAATVDLANSIANGTGIMLDLDSVAVTVENSTADENTTIEMLDDNMDNCDSNTWINNFADPKNTQPCTADYPEIR